MQKNTFIDGSLRLWSDEIDLCAIVAAAGWNVDHMHLRGDVVSAQGRRASRHYAAIKAVRLNRDEDVLVWLTAMADQIRRRNDLATGLSSGRIEAVIWLAVFGDDVQPPPNVNEQALAQLAEQYVRVLIKNYTDLGEDGLPQRSWLTPPRDRT